MPVSHKFFSDIRYFVSPRRSNQRRQNARVPKFSFITFNKCFDFPNLKKMCFPLSGTYSTLSSGLQFKQCVKTHKLCCHSLCLLSNAPKLGYKPERNMPYVEILHVMWTLHVIVNIAFTGASKRLDGIELVLLQREVLRLHMVSSYNHNLFASTTKISGIVRDRYRNVPPFG